MVRKEDILRYLQNNNAYYMQKYGVRFIALFGSYARDEANEKSDIDILYTIEKNRKFSLFALLNLTKELEDRFGTRVDLVRIEAIKPKLKTQIAKTTIFFGTEL